MTLLTFVTVGCSTSVVDESAESALVKEQLIIKVNESLKKGDSKSAATPVPLTGDVSASGGDLFRSTKDDVIKHYQEQLDKVVFVDYAFLEEPTVTFLSDKSCYVTFKIHWTYMLKDDSTQRKRDFISSSLLVGKKGKDVWETVASAQTNK